MLLRKSMAVCAAVIAAALAACGGQQTTAHSAAIGSTTVTSETQESAPTSGVPPRPAPTKHATGPGRLLAPVILYRLLQDDPESPSYWAYFRTQGAFAPTGGDGTLTPGQIWIGDAWDDHDGITPLGAGTPRGRCYSWGVPRTSQLDQTAIGAPVQVTLRLARTTGVQQRTAHLRDASAGFFTPAFRRQLARIGCRLRPQHA